MRACPLRVIALEAVEFSAHGLAPVALCRALRAFGGLFDLRAAIASQNRLDASSLSASRRVVSSRHESEHHSQSFRRPASGVSQPLQRPSFMPQAPPTCVSRSHRWPSPPARVSLSTGSLRSVAQPGRASGPVAQRHGPLIQLMPALEAPSFRAGNRMMARA